MRTPTQTGRLSRSFSVQELGNVDFDRVPAGSTPEMNPDDYIITPRMLAEKEQCMNAYLSLPKGYETKLSDLEYRTRISAYHSAGSGDNEAGSTADVLTEEALRGILDTPVKPMPFKPLPTAVPQQLLEPLSETEAVNVLQKSRYCTGMGYGQLIRFLRAGTRKLLPRYAVAMREGSLGNAVYIILRGRVQAGESRIEMQHRENQQLGLEGLPQQMDTDSLLFGPGEAFGILEALLPVVHERNVVSLESTELLAVSLEQVRHALGITHTNAFATALKSAFIEAALPHVNFFATLPSLTRRQVASLFNLRFYRKGEHIFLQGDEGREMFVILWGNVSILRQQRRREAEKVCLGKYSGSSTYPWFGEIFQWVHDHGRAGDALVTEDALFMSLDKTDVAQFMLFVPGFKALSMSAASSYFAKPQKVFKEDETSSSRKVVQREKPLQYAVQWVRIIGRLLGADGGWKAATAGFLHQAKKMKENNMDWVHEVMEAPVVGNGDDDVIEKVCALSAEQQKRLALAFAHRTSFGDSRTLANAAGNPRKKGWRASWDQDYQVRAELLRLAAKQPGGIKGAEEHAWIPTPSDFR